MYFCWPSLGVCDLIWVSRTSHLVRHICVPVSIFAFEINHPFIWHALHLFISYSFSPVFILNYQSLILAILKSCRVCSWLISISFIFINDGNEALWTNQDEKKNLMEITSIFLDISNLLKKNICKILIKNSFSCKKPWLISIYKVWVYGFNHFTFLLKWYNYRYRNTDYRTWTVREKGLSLKFLHEIPIFLALYLIIFNVYCHWDVLAALLDEEYILHVICVRILQRWQTCYS